jgi:glycerol-3-phosphate dehydrogenase (NAD(P)+)
VSGIAVIGAGAWGTALAQSLAGAGHAVTLWCRDAGHACLIAGARRNDRRLPGIALHCGIAVTADPEATHAAIRIVAVPAQHLRTVLAALPVSDGACVVTAKGIEAASGRFVHEIALESAGGAVALLSGPSFAGEVARGLPTALTLATADAALGRSLALTLGHPALRLYWTDDVRGVALGGALKNVLAIAAGIVIGRGLGENARAALLTRGLAELMRLGAALGARPETLFGLSGLGDLMLTANSLTSRNTALGAALGRGEALADLVDGTRGVAEGVWTAAAAARLADRLGVDAPIVRAVAAVVAGNSSIEAMVDSLLRRPQRPE